MAIPDKKMKSNPQGPGTQGPNQIAARDKQARKRRNAMRDNDAPKSGLVSDNLGFTPQQPGQHGVTPGNPNGTVGDNWARLTGTGRWANTPQNNWDRMTGTGQFAGSDNLNADRQRMFGAADAAARYAAAAPARRERALGGLADFRHESAGGIGGSSGYNDFNHTGPAPQRPGANRRPGAQRALNSFGGRLASSSIVARTRAGDKKSPPTGTTPSHASRLAGGMGG